MNVRACILSSFVLGLVACGAADPETTGASTAPANDRPLITRTIVTRAADGSQTVKTQEITRETQLGEIAARASYVQQLQQPVRDGIGKARSAISTDDGCGGSSLWLFDGEALTGNEICFIGAGDASLAQFADGPAVCNDPASPCFYPTWARSVRSLWAGVDAGYLAACYGVFKAWERQDTLGAAARDSSFLTLTSGDLCPL